MTTPDLWDHEQTKYTKAASQMRLSTASVRSAAACRCGGGALVLLALALALGCEGLPASASQGHAHHIAKRSFFDLQCKGIYEASIFIKVDNVCSDCFSLFREYELHALCRKECFTSHYFKGCMESLQKEDQMEEFKIYIQQLHGAPSEV